MELTGFPVASNSTAMIHTEQMIDLGGAIIYSSENGAARIVNQTGLTFDNAKVLRMTADKKLQAAVLGQFPPTAAGRTLEFRDVPSAPDVSPTAPEVAPADAPRATSADGARSLSLEGLSALVETPHGFHPGDVRLVATLDSALPGMDIAPAASQTARGAVLVVAHLHFAPLPEPHPDLKGRPDAKNSPLDEPMENGEPTER